MSAVPMSLENRFSPWSRGRTQPWPPFPQMLDGHISAHPEQLQPMTTDLVARLEKLVGAADVDLDAPLAAGDEEYEEDEDDGYEDEYEEEDEYEYEEEDDDDGYEDEYEEEDEYEYEEEDDDDGYEEEEYAFYLMNLPENLLCQSELPSSATESPPRPLLPGICLSASL